VDPSFSPNTEAQAVAACSNLTARAHALFETAGISPPPPISVRANTRLEEMIARVTWFDRATSMLERQHGIAPECEIIAFPQRPRQAVTTTDSAENLNAWRARIERARRIPIETEIARRGIRLTGKGAEREGPCPRCAGNDRFSINTQKQTWNCRGCKTEQDKGDVIGLVCWLDGVEFATAVNTLTGEKVKTRRKTQERTFTYCDPSTGEPVYDKTRIDYDDGSKGLFFPAGAGEGREGMGRNGSEPLLFGGERLADINPSDPVWIVEGEKQVLRLRELGAIAVCGDSAANSKWLPAHAALFRGLNAILWPDSDSVGEDYIARAATCLAATCLKEEAASLRVVRPFGPPNGSKGLDVCDWQGTPEQLAELAADAVPYELINVRDAPETEIITVCAKDITPQRYYWVWRYWLARGKLHLVAGAPETGKTTVALSYAAVISSGGKFPDCTIAETGNTLIWTSEDDPADTLIPRLMRMGADLSRIHFIKQTRKPGEKIRPFNPAADMPELSKKAKAIGNVSLVILDPVVAAVPLTRNSHSNTETRVALQPVVDFAQEIMAAVIGITHLTKGTSGKDPLERVTGSLAFGALPRLVMFTALNLAEGDDEPERIMVRVKSNIGPRGGGFGFHIDAAPLLEHPDIEATRIIWDAPIIGNARELLAKAEAVDEQKMNEKKEAKAVRLLTDMLANGELPQSEIEEAAIAEGISGRTLQRAATKDLIRKRKDGFTGRWFWSLI
jgi:putative DNA primase/helicase